MPRRPSTICESCWDGVISEHLGFLHPPIQIRPSSSTQSDEPRNGEYSYTSTWAEIQSGATEGCRWCQLISTLEETVLEDSDGDTPLVIVAGRHVVVAGKHNEEVSWTSRPSAQKEEHCTFAIRINGELRLSGYLYADAGK